MAKSTFLQLCQVAGAECGLTQTISTISPTTTVEANIVRWIASGDVETQGRWFNWDFLHVDTWSAATVIGTQAVAAPADIGVWDTDSFYLDYSTDSYSRLRYMDYSTWRATLRQGVKTNGTPDIVVVKPNQSLVLEPPPVAVRTLTADYWRRPLKMLLTDDTSLIPEEYERIIIARAKISYGEFESAQEVLASGQVEYDDLLDKLEAKYLPSSQLARRASDGSGIVVIPQ